MLVSNGTICIPTRYLSRANGFYTTVFNIDKMRTRYHEVSLRTLALCEFCGYLQACYNTSSVRSMSYKVEERIKEV